MRRVSQEAISAPGIVPASPAAFAQPSTNLFCIARSFGPMIQSDSPLTTEYPSDLKRAMAALAADGPSAGPKLVGVLMRVHGENNGRIELI